jgi:hypothetical protein
LRDQNQTMRDAYPTAGNCDQDRSDHGPKQKGGRQADGLQTKLKEAREDDKDHPLLATGLATEKLIDLQPASSARG